jgi:hypothetical protein
MPSFRRNLLPLPHILHFQPILPLTRALWTLSGACVMLGRYMHHIRICLRLVHSDIVTLAATSFSLLFFIHLGVLLSYMATEVGSLSAEYLRRNTLPHPFLGCIFVTFRGFCTLRAPLSLNACFCSLKPPFILIAYVFQLFEESLEWRFRWRCYLPHSQG